MLKKTHCNNIYQAFQNQVPNNLYSLTLYHVFNSNNTCLYLFLTINIVMEVNEMMQV